MYCFEAGGSFKLLTSCTLDHPIASLSWSLNYSQLILGTADGSILSLHANKLEDGATSISCCGTSTLVGVDVVAPGTTHCVVSDCFFKLGILVSILHAHTQSCREDGAIQVWSIEGGQLISSLKLNTKVCNLFRK